MTNEELRQLARAGLAREREQLAQRLSKIRSLEEDLDAVAITARTKKTRKSYAMSASARKAVSARMKKYWAERRRQQK